MPKSDSIWVNLEHSLLEQISKHGTSWSKIQRSMPGVTIASMRGRWARINSPKNGKQLCRICKKPRRGHLYSTCQSPSIQYNSPSSTKDGQHKEEELPNLELPTLSVASVPDPIDVLNDVDSDSLLTLHSMEPSSSLQTISKLNSEQTLSDNSASCESLTDVDEILDSFGALEENSYILLQQVVENSKAIEQLQTQTQQIAQEIAMLRSKSNVMSSTVMTNPHTTPRHIMTPWQRDLLIKCYEKSDHPTSDVKQKLAFQLDLSKKQVNDWFTNRRKRSKVTNALQGNSASC